MSYMSCVRIHKNSEKCASSDQHTFWLPYPDAGLCCLYEYSHAHNPQSAPHLNGQPPPPPLPVSRVFWALCRQMFWSIFYSFNYSMFFFFSEIRYLCFDDESRSSLLHNFFSPQFRCWSKRYFFVNPSLKMRIDLTLWSGLNTNVAATSSPTIWSWSKNSSG